MTGVTALPGVRVGHAHDPVALTGCTVLRFAPPGAVCAVDVRGAGPGTREIALLEPENLVERVHAIVLSGGSAFGLAAASGVADAAAAEGEGLEVGPGLRVPIVPAAVLFDLFVGDGNTRPDASFGARAWAEARADAPLSGNLGAGMGATVGKLLGPERAMKGGLGSALMPLPGGGRISALLAVNALGEVRAEDGQRLAGIRGDDGALIPAEEALSAAAAPIGTNTTIGAIVTDLPLSKTQLKRVAQMAHDGLARAIFPAHTMFDGDTLFAASVAERVEPIDPARLSQVGSFAAVVCAAAVRDAVRAARSVPGCPAACELEAVTEL